ncbi:MAG: DNA-directed RNA polymerase subunit alpha C-terminal domain-containing protein [Ilumatobacteraceae bacterium]
MKVSIVTDEGPIGLIFEEAVQEIRVDGVLVYSPSLVRALESLRKLVNSPDLTQAIPEESREVVLARSIRRLGVSRRVVDMLVRAGIHTIGDLVGKTENDLLNLPRFGYGAFNEVQYQIDRLGLQLRQD